METQLVKIRSAGIGYQAAELVMAVGISGHCGDQYSIAVKRHRPPFQQRLGAVVADPVQVGVVPDVAVEDGAARCAAHVD